MEHANKLVEVANLACSMSSNEEGVKIVRLAAAQLESLCPQASTTYHFFYLSLLVSTGVE